MSISRTVLKKVLAVETPEGAGALVRRSIGSMALRNLTPFLMLDHFHVSEGAGFPDHPHRGQATVTYMLEGVNTKIQRAIKELYVSVTATLRLGEATGGVQWMCAGKGIIHAEMPVHGKGLPEPRGLQLWVDLPEKFKMSEPSYQELSPEKVPVAYPEGVDGPIKIKIISGKSHGVESPVRPLGGCWFFHITFNKEGSMFQELPAGWTSFLYSWKGTLSVGADKTSVPAFHTAVLSANTEENGIALSGVQGTELVLVAGEPLDQKVVQYGPFVMTTKEGIQKTLIDYQTGRNGFEKAHSWKSEIAHKV